MKVAFAQSKLDNAVSFNVGIPTTSSTLSTSLSFRHCIANFFDSSRHGVGNPSFLRSFSCAFSFFSCALWDTRLTAERGLYDDCLRIEKLLCWNCTRIKWWRYRCLKKSLRTRFVLRLLRVWQESMCWMMMIHRLSDQICSMMIWWWFEKDMYVRERYGCSRARCTMTTRWLYGNYMGIIITCNARKHHMRDMRFMPAHKFVNV